MKKEVLLYGVRGINFNLIKTVNRPKSIHGIYPYRGKISSIEASGIIKQIPAKAVLLDPFCGSGTIIFESIINNVNAVGVDNNPLAYILTKGKVNSLGYDKENFVYEIKKIISKSKNLDKFSNMPKSVKKHFHKLSAKEIMKVSYYFDNMSDYLKAAFLGAIALTARGCNHYKWTSSTVGKDINPKRYINFYDKFEEKVLKHHPKIIKENNSRVFLGDSRKLSEIIPEKSVDFVFTSPPYFNCLDYTSYYGKIILEILGYNRLKIKKKLIQNIKSYKEDMKEVMEEIIKVTKDNAKIIFVVGDKKIGKEIIKGSDLFSELIKHRPVKVIEREYTNSSSQIFDKLNKTKRKEQIIIWDKSKW